MKIQSKFKTYNVDFVNNLSSVTTLKENETVFFALDRNIYGIYKNEFKDIAVDRLYLIDAAEQNKTMDTVLDICERMTSMSSKRNTHLVSIGGGITQDITGFVANILYRGIKWTFFPSTLLAACDSCIGGKTSLNCRGFKNLLGTFYPPDEIKIYPEFFKSLSDRDFYSGLGEIVKFNVMAGKIGIDRIESNIGNLLARDAHTISEFCHNSLAFKKDFIEEDEFDKGRRILLNYAHTFGHAFETSSNYEIPHGSAVAMGMIVANRISVGRGILKDTFAKRVENVCKQILTLHLEEAWLDNKKIISAVRKDKKQVNSSIRAVLIRQNLTLAVYEDLTEEEIFMAINELKLLLGVDPPPHTKKTKKTTHTQHIIKSFCQYRVVA